MQNVKEYIEQHKQRFLDELFDLLRIPSVSAVAAHNNDMKRAAEYIKQRLLDAGADRVEIMPTDGFPVVYGEKMVNPKAPTVLVYGHYDVQPVDPLNLWHSAPFEPQVRDGKIFARGADDDKGQMYMHVKAFELMSRTGQLPCNVKFMIEGEEEVGSANLPKFCEQHKDLLRADVILVSDTTMISPDVPSVTVGLRGLSYMEVEVTGPKRDLHSGMYGGAVANPANVLARMIASMHDENNHITIPGFYDDVQELSTAERALMAKNPFDLEAYKRALDIDQEQGEKGYTTNERIGIRPTLDVNGMWSGYTGEGAKTVLPSKAYAKISMRLVPNQSSEKIANLFEKHFTAIAPKSVKVKVSHHHGGEPYVSPIDMPAYVAASKAYETTFGKVPVPQRSGGSIPIVTQFERILGMKTILMGFGLDSDAIHSPNENYPLWNFYKGIETIPYFYHYFAQMYK